MTVLKVVVFVGLLLIALVFAYYNMQEVRLTFLNYSLSVPLFLTVIAGFSAGFLVAYLVSEIRRIPLKRFRDKSTKGLTLLWTGHLKKAEGILRSLSRNEEMVPLYVLSRREQGKEPDTNPERYGAGIAEVSLAEHLLRSDPKRARDLLERALGKNWGNLRARRILRTLYFIEGDSSKAVDLQRSLVRDSDQPLKQEEEKILASMLSEAFGEKALEEIDRLPKTLSSMALMISKTDEEKVAKVFERAVQEGMGTDLLALLWERKTLSPAILDVTVEREEAFDPDLLALLYADLGLTDRLEGLKEKVSTPIRFLTQRDREVCREVLKILDLWVCEVCGMGYRSYTPVCVGCFSWNRLKIKGGRDHVNRLLKRDS